MSAQHTPGPWDWNEGGRLFHSVPNLYSENVLVVHDPVWRPRDADRKLIAAAPELLAALEAVMREFFPHATTDEYPELRDARAAIAKATGK